MKGCYENDYEKCLLLIRWKNRLWGNRTPLELGDLASAENFMAHQAVQDSNSKIIFQPLLLFYYFPLFFLFH